MKTARLAFTAIALALSACVSLPNDTRPHGIETARRTETADQSCEFGYHRVYRPVPGKDREAPYDAVIPPDYDAPSQVPSDCRRLPD